MSLNKLLNRIVFVFFIVSLFVLLFYYISIKTLESLSINDEQLDVAAVELTVLFIFLTVSFMLIYVFLFVTDYKRSVAFLKDLKSFLNIVHEGTFREKMFYGYYPGLEDIYECLNMIYDDLREKFVSMERRISQLNATIESIPDSIVIIDNENIVVYTNDKANELFKQTRTSIIGKPLIEVLRSADLNDALDNAKRYDKSDFIEIIFQRFNEDRYLNIRISPFYRKNDLTGLIILFHDMTEMKKLESMRKDFVANVTHEIKTPVTAITGFAETLLDGALDDRENATRFLRTIKFHGERLNRLVDDLMTISKIELGVIKLDRTTVQIGQLIETVVETLNEKARLKGLSIEINIDNDQHFLDADRDRLIQVLINLIDNAIKFTQNGTIEVGYKKDERGINYIFVCDTGVGVPKRYISRLGERFFRVDDSRSRDLGGTGLGLAIVKHIVKAHDWEMKIDSEEGVGTTFKIVMYD